MKSKAIAKINKLFVNNKFLERIVTYLVISVICLTISIYISFEKILPTDGESAQSLISVLIQSEATVLAIIISVSLVAVQQTASYYSPRVTKIFMDKNRNPDFWILILIYIVAMIHAMFILKQINCPIFFTQISWIGHENLGNIINTLFGIQTSIWFTLFLGFIAFCFLYPYIRNILLLLEPSKTIDFLAEDITEQKIKEAIDAGKTKDYDDNDPIHSIIDIIRISLINFDNQKAMKGFSTIETQIKNILRSDTFRDQYFKKMSENLTDHLLSIGKIALKNDNENFVLKVLRNICEIGEQSINKNVECIVLKSIDSIEQIGKIAVQRKMEYASAEALDCLRRIGKNSLSLKMKNSPSPMLNDRKTKYIIKKVALSATEIEKESMKSGMNLVKKEANSIREEMYPELTINSDSNLGLLLLTRSEEIYNELKFSESKDPEKYTEALNYVNKALEMKEENYFDDKTKRDALVLKGEILSKQDKEKFDIALVAYNEALKLNSKDVEVLVRMGNLLCQLSKEREAYKVYEKACNLNKDDIFVWYHKASFYFSISDYEKSLKICNKILDIESNCTYASGLKDLCIGALNNK